MLRKKPDRLVVGVGQDDLLAEAVLLGRRSARRLARRRPELEAVDVAGRSAGFVFAHQVEVGPVRVLDQQQRGRARSGS